MPPESLATRHIGAAGELLVQYKLLKLGIDSARMTTDNGIDLVVYPPKTALALTIQVKTKRKPGQAGGRGRSALGWTVADTCPAALVALVDLATDRVWLFTLSEFSAQAQQHAASGTRQLYMYVDAPRHARHPRVHVSDYDAYLLEHRIDALFNTAQP